MKKCPNCAVEMERSMYEGFGVHQCPQCHGNFVRESSLEGIKRTREMTSSDLVQNAQQAEDANTTHDVVCPGCFTVMEKKHTLGFPKVEYDSCPSCSGIWLDPGELEMLQLVYEASNKGQADLEMRDDFDEFMMDSDRQKRFRSNLAKCKDPEYTTWGAIKGGIAEGFISSYSRHKRVRWDNNYHDL